MSQQFSQHLQNFAIRVGDFVRTVDTNVDGRVVGEGRAPDKGLYPYGSVFVKWDADAPWPGHTTEIPTQRLKKR